MSVIPSSRLATHLHESPLYAICDVDSCTARGWTALDFVKACLDGGVRLLQLRAKRLASGPFLELVDAAVHASAAYDAGIVVNDRLDLARLGNAAGVHVGQDDLPVDAVRRQLGSEAIVGLSTHTIAQCAAAGREAVSYVAVGPVFETATKRTGYDTVGLDLVTAARRAVPDGIPIVAIGGITLERASSVMRAGASAVAVIGNLLTDAPAARVAQFHSAIRRIA